MATRRRETPAECGQCGESIPSGAYACPACGADENTGWDANPWMPDEAQLGIPDYLTEDFDPDVDGDHGIPGIARPLRTRVLATIAAIVVASLALGYVLFTMTRQ